MNQKLFKLFFVALILNCIGLRAQKVQFSYDRNGNSVQRKLYCSGCPESGRQAKPNEKKNQQTATQLGLSVFPNPAQEKIEVSISNLKQEYAATILLIDDQGKTLLTQKSTSQVSSVDMSSYRAGIYFIRVVVGSESLSYKIIKL